MNKLRAVLRERSVRSVFALLGGTSLAQLLAVLALPVLTRMYTPDDFSILAVFTAVAVVISIAACLRFDVAIALPDSERDAAGLFVLSSFFCALISSITAIGVALVQYLPVGDLIALSVRRCLWLLPVVVLSLGLFSALQYLATRNKQFNGIAKARIKQAVACVFIQLLLGYGWWADVPGLLYGYIVGGLFGVWGLYRAALPAGLKTLTVFTRTELRALFGKYEQFPRYSVFEALANSAGIQLSIVLIAALADGPEAGYLMIAMRALGIPMSLLGGAVGQVYLSEAPAAARNGSLGAYTEQVISRLMMVGVGPLVYLSIVGPTLFPFIFGPGWERAGELVLWMMPWFVLQFLASPISMVMHVKGRQKVMLLLTLGGLVARLGGLVAVAYLERGSISQVYAVSSALFYALCLFVFLRVADVSVVRSLSVLLRKAYLPLGWSLLGVVSAYFAGEILR
jgi:O-antigen/teichoic acid export membrane protein